MSDIFKFINKCPKDTAYINRLFVTAFLWNKNYSHSDIGLLNCYCMSSEEDIKIVKQFINLLTRHVPSFTLEYLVKLFEFVISPADRIVTGAIYTPQEIRDTIIENCLKHYNEEELKTIRVADIACGCGGFLMDVARYINKRTGKCFKEIFTENIYGVDIQNYSIERTKILLSLLALENGESSHLQFNLLCRDTLEYNTNLWENYYSNFDVIVGNPPYVCSRNVSTETKIKMKAYEVCRSGHPDLYIPFFQIAIGMLKENGRLGYITMNTFLRSINGRSLRYYFSQNQFSISIIDFRGYQVFHTKSTYTCLFFLQKNKNSNYIQYHTCENGNLNNRIKYEQIPYSLLNDKKGWNLNDFVTTQRIEEIGTPLGKYCQSRHGIATLSNETFIFMPINEDNNYYYLKCNDIIYPIERHICRNIVNPNSLNSNTAFDSIIEKVIFPYKEYGGKMMIISEFEMQKKYPQTLKYLCSQRSKLEKRDKGNTKHYPTWYAYGRTQSLKLPKYKLFFPKFASQRINCVLRDEADLMLYNGLAFISDDVRQLSILQRILESNIFWMYVIKNGKPYASNYYSLSGVDIKNFGIPLFSKEQEEQLLSLCKKNEIDSWLENFYQ